MTDNRKPDKGLDALLAQPEVWPQSDAAACPEAEIVAAYFERSLPSEASSAWEAHFSRCARCQEQLAALARATTAQPEAALAPREKFAWANVLRWLVPVAATVALALVVTIQISVRTATEIAQTQISQSRDEIPMAQPAAPIAADTSAERRSAQKLSSPEMGKVEKKVAEAPPRDARAKEEFAVVTKPDAQVSADAAKIPPTAPAAVARVPAANAAAEKNRQEQLVVVESAEAQRPQAAAPRPQAAAEGAGQAPQQAPAKTLQAAPMRRDEPAAQPAGRAAAARESEAAKMEPPQVPPKQAFGVLKAKSAIKAQPVMVVSVKGKTMWRIGVSGEVDASSDAGRTWKRQSLPDGTFIYAASAPEENVCWLAGRAGALYRTTNGERWEKLPPPVNEDLVSVRATSAQAAEVRAASGRSYVTRDAGRTWSPKE